MNKEQFIEEIRKYSREHAMSCVVDPEEHLDAVEAIEYDYIEGAIKAFEIIYNTTWDDEK